MTCTQHTCDMYRVLTQTDSLPGCVCGAGRVCFAIPLSHITFTLLARMQATCAVTPLLPQTVMAAIPGTVCMHGNNVYTPHMHVHTHAHALTLRTYARNWNADVP